MSRYVLNRIGQTLVTLAGMSVVVFMLARLTGDPTPLIFPMIAKPEDLEFMRHQLGLDRPWYEQYFVFLANVLRGEFGVSFYWREPAMLLVLERMPATLQLTGAALLVALVIGLPIGIFAAVYHGSMLDKLARGFALFGQSMPVFWLGLMLILLVSVQLRLLPTSGRGTLAQMVLPALTMGWFSAAAVARLTRSSMLEVLTSEYIKMARIKGTPERIVIWRHALKNAAIPILTLTALQFGHLLGGAVVTERIFAWPGVGSLTVEAIFHRDFPVIQAAVLFASLIFMMLNLLVDLAYGYLDPRIRFR